MLSREVMKAAEKLDHMLETMTLSEWTDEVAYDDVKPLVSHILAHREDYDADGRPLEVTVAVAEAFGFTIQRSDEDSGYFCTDAPTLLELFISDEGGTPIVWIGSYWLESSLRPINAPELRRLIEKLRAGGPPAFNVNRNGRWMSQEKIDRIQSLANQLATHSTDTGAYLYSELANQILAVMGR